MQTSRLSSSSLILIASLSMLIPAMCTRKASQPDKKAALNEAWRSSLSNEETPEIMAQKGKFELEYNFEQLPLKGKSIKQPWSGHYWPNVSKGIFYRWQEKKVISKVPKGKVIEIKRKKGKINLLSAAEKFDLLLGRYDRPWGDAYEHMPLSQSERNKRNTFSFAQETWTGMCHGWAPAAIQEPEPGMQATLRNRFGMDITFYRDDIKALLTRLYAPNSGAGDAVVGKKCRDEFDDTFDEFGPNDSDERSEKRSCRDSNPGAIHVLLTNIMGIQGDSVVIDRDPGEEVWNQPLSSYAMTKGPVTRLNWRSWRRTSRAPGTVYLVDVELDLVYVNEHKGGSLQARPQEVRHMYMKYSLELDQDKKIIGGEWYPHYYQEKDVRVSYRDSKGRKQKKTVRKKVWGRTLHPDFIWMMYSKPINDPLIPANWVYKILRESLKNPWPENPATLDSINEEAEFSAMVRQIENERQTRR